jgi:hypothetical protein
MSRQDESVAEWMRKLAERRDSPAEESRRLISLLVLGSLLGSIALVLIVTWMLSAPLIVAIFVALLFLCLDAVAIAIVWYSSQRR